MSEPVPISDSAPVMALDEPARVRDEERLDPDRLAPFVRDALGAAGPVEVLQFRKGHSNLTYLVRAGDREAVLRRAPFGASVKSAHDMRREFTILSALQGVYPRAPRPIAFCDDEGLLGARFYLMERVRGVVLRGGDAGPELSPERMRALSTALVDALAELHAVDVTRGPLASIGRPDGYVARQVAGWVDRWRKAQTDDAPDLDEITAWIERHRPAESGAALVHNDFKYDNLVLDPDKGTRIRAVLDWEMATVGDPLMDLGTTLGYWVDPDDPDEVRALPFGPTALPGNLPRRELARRYVEVTGGAERDVLFHYVFALFKIAVIAQQIYRRFRDGHTRDPRFAALVAGVGILGRQAERAIDAGRIHALAR